MTKVSNRYIINLTTRKEVIQLLDMFDIFEVPEEEVKAIEQFIPLEEAEEKPTEQIDSVTKQYYDSLVETIEEIKTLLTTEKE